MADKKAIIISEIIPVMSKITEHKLNSSNYLDWSKTEFMEYLDFLYSGEGNISCIYEVCKAFYRAKEHDRSLTGYFMDFKGIYEELNMLLPFSPDVKIQQSQRKKMTIMSFFYGLPFEFETAKSQILFSSEITSLQDVFSRELQSSPPVQYSGSLVSQTNEYEAERSHYKGGFLVGMLGGTEEELAASVQAERWPKWKFEEGEGR
ncbi:hypothetical protein SADUNF_Sadunf16G0004800 [Salix dunnii]|uniref:Uncharacterized protein n=1 Tax=Salix dunnii TaxID=1413687 RepID=A0A835J8D9_9ROSI|nr:hypothetical protein SADUNF_Sadunf16G0004800 [Salix dunnii]